MASVALSYETLSDIELARRIAQRDSMAARLVIKRNNQCLYRAAWSVLKDRSEAEEAVQDGYLKAFAAIGSFAGKSSLSTWLTRIVLNEALGQRRSAQRRSRQLREQSVAIMEEYREKLISGSDGVMSPEADVARSQIAKLLEAAVADLPEAFRLVLMLRWSQCRRDRRGPSDFAADRQDASLACAETAASHSRPELARCFERGLPVRWCGLRRTDRKRVGKIWGWHALDCALPLLALGGHCGT
jgi:RNA polymerase sigma factor (sigma-70 family)